MKKLEEMETLIFLSVDFDNTIAEDHFPNVGPEVPGAIKWLKRYNELGVNIIIYTMRASESLFGNLLKPALELLKKHDIEIVGVNQNPIQTWTSSLKPWSQIIIDDAAVGCPLKNGLVDWDIVGPETERRILSLLDGKSTTVKGFDAVRPFIDPVEEASGRWSLPETKG